MLKKNLNYIKLSYSHFFKLNHLKTAELERNALKSSKDKAVEFLEKENEISKSLFFLYNSQKKRNLSKIDSLKSKLEETQQSIDDLTAQVNEKDSSLKELIKASTSGSKKFQKLQSNLTKLKNDLADAEAEETKFNKLKSHSKKDKKKFEVILFNKQFSEKQFF